MSEIWNGPKKGNRKPKQLRTTSSTSCGEASPSSTQRTASRKRAFWMRLATKPGPSPTTAGRLPMERKNSTSRPTISGAVAAEGMTSTPGVHSGGLNQCIPQKRPGRPTNSERSLMGSDDVLETMTASCGAAEQELRISSFNPMSSGTASKTRSASATVPSTSSAVFTASALPTALSANSPASACPLVRLTSRPFASLVSSGVASVRSTLMPAAAKHSATPSPMVPAPMTAVPRGQPWWDSLSSTRQALRSQDGAACDQRHRQKCDGCQGDVRRPSGPGHFADHYRFGHNPFGVIDRACPVLVVRRRRATAPTGDTRRANDTVVAIRVERRVSVRERRVVADIVAGRSHYRRASVLGRDRDPSLLVGEDCPCSVAICERYGRAGRDGAITGGDLDQVGRTVGIVCIHTSRGRARGYAAIVLRPHGEGDEDQRDTQHDKNRTRQRKHSPHPYPPSAHNQRRVLCLMARQRATCHALLEATSSPSTRG